MASVETFLPRKQINAQRSQICKNEQIHQGVVCFFESIGVKLFPEREQFETGRTQDRVVCTGNPFVTFFPPFQTKKQHYRNY